MLLDRYNVSRRYIDEYLRDNEIFTDCSSDRNILEVSSMDLLIEFAKVGLGIACVIKEFVRDELEKGLLKAIPLPVPIPEREIGFAVLRNRPFNEALDSFLEFCK